MSRPPSRGRLKAIAVACERLLNSPSTRKDNSVLPAMLTPTPSQIDSRAQGLDVASSSLDRLRERLDAMYTPLETAVKELRKRRLHFAGRTPGRDWLPAGLPNHPPGYAFLSRYIATPNPETRRFLDLVDGTGMLPVIAEFAQDKFVTLNPLKRALARMGIQRGHNRHGQALVEFINVLDDNQQGRPLAELKTFWGQYLIAFHHELLAYVLNGGGQPTVCDTSRQCARAGGTPAACYRDFYLQLCVADGILFEDFLLDQLELPYTRDVVLPAFDEVTTRFGLRPLIVHITLPEERNSPHWYWYPRELKEFVKNRLKEVRA